MATTAQQAAPAAPQDMFAGKSAEELVSMYVRLRDALKKADDAHKERTKVCRATLETLNAKLLAELNSIGGDSISTKEGTVYRSTKNTASISDGDQFRAYVIQNELWDLLDWKANATAVKDFIDNNQALPPGVNFTTTFTAGVRRK